MATVRVEAWLFSFKLQMKNKMKKNNAADRLKRRSRCFKTDQYLQSVNLAVLVTSEAGKKREDVYAGTNGTHLHSRVLLNNYDKA